MTLTVALLTLAYALALVTVDFIADRRLDRLEPPRRTRR